MEQLISNIISEEELNKLIKIQNMIITVGKELGKGCSKLNYKQALLYELRENNIVYISDEIITIPYKGITIGSMKMDINLPKDNIVIELKCISDFLINENKWQLLNYMKHTITRFGILINYNQSEYLHIEIIYLIYDNIKDEVYECNVSSGTYIYLHGYKYDYS